MFKKKLKTALYVFTPDACYGLVQNAPKLKKIMIKYKELFKPVCIAPNRVKTT